MKKPVVVLDSSIEPITLQEAKAQCRIDVDDSKQDDLIETYIAAARRYVEWRTNRTIHQKTLRHNLSCWPGWNGPIVLPFSTPLIEVSSVVYYDTAGGATTLAASDYLVDADSMPGSIVPAYGLNWPSFERYPVNPIRITYTAGISTTSPVAEASEDVRYALKLLVAGMFENRESEVITDRAVVNAIAMNYGVEAYIARLRVEHPA